MGLELTSHKGNVIMLQSELCSGSHAQSTHLRSACRAYKTFPIFSVLIKALKLDFI